MTPIAARPLLVTADAGLLDAVLAVASEARIDLDVAPDAANASARWASAPVVLIDPTSATALGQLPPRQGVIVISRTVEDAATWRRLTAFGAERVVELPGGAPWLYERLGRSLDSEPVSEILVVLGAVGGAGASTLAAAIASHNNSSGASSVLVDLDPAGAGIDLMLGGEIVSGARWDELAGIAGRVDERILTQALPRAEGLAMVSWPASGELEPDGIAVGHVLDALARSESLVVVDGGRGTDSRALVALGRSTRAALVVPLRVRAVAAAKRALQRLPQHVEPLIITREPAPGGLTCDDVAGALGVPVVATLLEDRHRPMNEELGSPAPDTAPWRRVCGTILSGSATVAA